MKIYFILLLLLFIINTNEVICSDKDQKIGVKAGIVQSNMLMKDNDGTYSKSNPNSGFLVGLTASFITSKVISFEIGCVASKKGLKYNYDVITNDYYRRDTTNYNGNLYILYGIIPINLKVGVPIGDFKIYGILGGYLASAYYGHDNGTKTNGKNIDIVDNDIDFDYQYNFEKIDYGLNFGFGAEAYNIFLECAYEHGLYNISKNTSNGFTLNNRSFSLAIGYNFNI